MALCGGMAARSATPSVQVTARIDSVDVMQGALRKIDVEVIQPEGMNLRWLTDGERQADGHQAAAITEVIPGVEVNSSTTVDTVALGNGRLQLNRTVLIQPWDSGEFVIPGIALVAGTDTFRSNNMAIKVYTANIDTMTTIHSWAPAVAPRRHFWDWVPDWIADYWWAYLLGLVAIGAGIAAYVIHRRGGLKNLVAPKEKPIPPYEKAITELQTLRTRQLCEKGREKEYYTELTEILRQYLEGRFGINAMEMTTTQIKRSVRESVAEHEAAAYMNEVLEMADYVKFARMRPMPEDNVRAMSQAVNFVELTKPADPAENPEEGDKK